MQHWAFPLIGQPRPEHGCREFVAELVSTRLGVLLPGIEDVQRSSWRRSPLAAADDVVLMHGPKGRHIGLWVETPARVGVLHAHGTVQFESLHSLQSHGYGRFEFWRLVR